MAHWNRDSPVAELTKELWAYSTHTRTDNQRAGSRAVMHRRVPSKSWLRHSVWPLLCGWNLEDRLAVAV